MKSNDVMLAQAVTAAILCRTYRNPITGAVLAEQFGIDLRKVTEIVAEARDAGIKIASSRGGMDDYLNVFVQHGYFQARTPEEMRSSADMVHATAMALLSREKRMMDFGGANPTIFEQSDGEAA